MQKLGDGLATSVPSTGRATRARWVVLGLLCALAAILYVDRICFSMALSSIKQDLGISDRDAGFLGVAFTIAYGVFEIPVGRWGDRVGPRAVLARIAVCWSLFTALTGACMGWGQLLVVRFLFGVGEAGAYPNTARVLARWFPDAERARAQGFLLAASQISLIGAMPLAALLVTRLGWRWMFVVFGALGVVWAAAFYAWFRDDPATHSAVGAAERAHIGRSRATAVTRHDPIPWGLVRSNPSVWLLCGTMICGAFNSYYYYFWFPTYLKEARGLSEDAAGWAMSLLYTGGSLGMLAGGGLTHRAFASGMDRDTATRLMGGLECAVAAVCLWIATTSDSSAPLIAFAAFSFACMAATQPLTWSCIIGISGRHVGSLFGLINMSGMVGAAASQYLVGDYIEQRKELGFVGRDKWDPVFTMYVVMLLVGGVCWALYSNRLVEPETAGSVHPPDRAPDEVEVDDRK
jgi:sugar phosphate permease